MTPETIPFILDTAMTLKTIEPEVPGELPQTRLYLDDLAQIRDLFCELALRHRPDERPVYSEPTIRAGNQETRDIDDLPKLGHQTRDLIMILTRSDLALIFRIGPHGAGWFSEGLPTPVAWQTHHQLEEILKRRPPRIRDVLPLTGPARARTAGFVTALVAVPVFMVHYLPTPHRTPETRVVTLMFGLPLVLLLFAAGVGLIYYTARHLGPSSVVLDYSYKEAARRTERRTQIWIATVAATLGLIAGLVLDALARRLMHW